jgi:hypothetical protein
MGLLVATSSRFAPSRDKPRDAGKRDGEQQELQQARSTVGCNAEETLDEIHGDRLP